MVGGARAALRALCVGTLCVFAVPCARAQGQGSGGGHWELYKTDYAGEQRIHTDEQTPDWRMDWSERAGLGHVSSYDTRTQPVGVGGFTSSEGRLRVWFRWVRRTIQQQQYYPGYGTYYQSVPDPNDNPPSMLVFAATVDVLGRANSDYSDNQVGPGPHRMPDAEAVTINVLGESKDGQDDGQLTKADWLLEKFYTVAAGGAMQTSPEGYEVVPGPWLDLSVVAALDGKRYYDSSSEPVAVRGVASRSLSFTAAPQNYSARLPDPFGLALAPCPDPTPQAPLNQYVMTGGGGVLTIPTVVTYTGNNTSFYYCLVRGLDWSLAGPMPSAMLPRVSNGSTTDSGSSTDLFPQHTTSASSTAVSGLAFDNVLPATNAGFGVNSVTHSFEGATFAVSPLAVFYQSNVYTHPIGASKWCQDDPLGIPGHLRPDYLISGYSPIPNWFHYYSQVWTPPCLVAYDPQGADGQSYFDPRFPDHVHVTDDSHGPCSTPIFEVRPGSPFVVKVGTQMHYGIDNFVAAVRHECTHKQIQEMLNSGALDSDNDHLPDVLEIGADLDPYFPDSSNSGFDDEEVYCKIRERNAEGPREADWANDGLNKGRVPGPCPANRHPISYSRAVRTRQSQSQGALRPSRYTEVGSGTRWVSWPQG